MILAGARTCCDREVFVPCCRLNDEKTIWLTTVRPDGQPQTPPVGFLGDGTRFLILSRPGAPKVPEPPGQRQGHAASGHGARSRRRRGSQHRGSDVR
ncbi:hypothetical protein F8566_19215 [Actinomadura rudentiformis]|uniref:Pyridoxamine 5'-phosphate oxidase N-terminal domain-containing protein n=1 Tax=Actinomadura rudentiformis TaxID=359158 RepID=A0A6H9YUD7_9ACTN|nr:hypothetical protein F8566_19215 [Actinomadura rudentiformis]